MKKFLARLPGLSRVISLVFICLLMFPNVQVLADDYSSDALKSIVNGTPYFKEEACTVSGSGSSTPLNGDDNISKIYNYFVSKGLKDYQAAGIMGSMKGESGFEPKKLQSTFNEADENSALAKGWITKVTPGDNGLVNAEDINLTKLDQLGSVGWGLVQWTSPSKMINPVKGAGKDPNDLSVQLDFLWGQLNNKWPDGWSGQAPGGGFNEKAAGDELKASQDVSSATAAFELKYERHSGAPQPARVIEAQKVLDRVKAGGSGGGTDTTPTGQGAAPSSFNTSDPIYILGDSITARSATKYKAALPNATISARVGRSWTSGGQEDNANTGTQGPANTAVDTDATAIKAAKTIVIALGTNGFEGSNPIDEMLTKISGINNTAKIYWVNVASGVPGKVPAFNSALQERQKAGKLTVIDWAKVVDPTGDGTNNPKQILEDGTHPRLNKVPGTDKTGVEMLVELVIGALGSGGGGSSSGGVSNQCACPAVGSAVTSSATNSSSVTDLNYTDPSRGNRPVGVTLWKPDGPGKYPLVMFAPGRNQNSKSDGYYKRYLKAMANSGFVVAGLNFSDNKDVSAAPSDADDVKFAIDKVIAEEQFKSLIDSSSIGMVGHSDGGFIADLVGYADNKKDSRIKAVMLENGAGYAGYTYGSGPALMGMVGTNDADNASSVESAYNSIKTPYSGLAKFKGADHDQYIVSESSQYKDAVDAITSAFLTRYLKNQVTNLTDPARAAEASKDKVDFESKGDGQAVATGSGDSTSSSAGCGSSSGGNTQGLSATILAYAWPEYRSRYKPQMPAYAEVVKNARAKDQYIGGNVYPGDDCGGFVTRALVDSGFLPGYNHEGKVSKGAANTWAGQIPWADANMQLIGHVTSSSQLQPGDVAFDSDGGHTWMFVGKIDGFQSEIASASYDDRAPMAGTEGLTYNGARWYRKK